jgi:Fe-S-cluster formation regulator IscX/YfhJ
MQSRSSRLAVLIDADNASARIADGLFEEIAKIGEASVRRIYGDFSSTRSKAWADILSKHAIIPQQQFAYTTGKNASDITLVIDAMDLLHSGRFDGFCLVSSDSDFTRLAARIREQGIDVFGFGEQKTPESFRQACRRFIYTENLLPEAQSADARTGGKALESLDHASRILTRIIADMETDDGWVELGLVGSQLANLAPDFDPRTYGFKKLSDLVRKLDALELQQNEGRHLRVRSRGNGSSEPPKPARRRRQARGGD